MPTLPANPNLDQLRSQAKELVRGARAGDRGALERIGAVSDEVTLAAAQLAISREYGLPSWPALKAGVNERNRGLEEVVEAFLAASVGYRVGRAARLLAERPEIASRWHLDPACAAGLLAVATLLLDAGAALSPLSNDRNWSPLRCAVTSANSGRANEPIVRLLLDRGATVQDQDLYLAGFAGSWCLRMLLERVPNVAGIGEQALGAPISSGTWTRCGSSSMPAPTRPDPLPRRRRPSRRRDPGGLAEGAPTEVIELLLSTAPTQPRRAGTADRPTGSPPRCTPRRTPAASRP